MNKSIKINWKLLGAEFANLSDEEQGNFFIGFVDEILTWNTHALREMQMLNIREKLTPKQREYIATIGWDGKK